MILKIELLFDAAVPPLGLPDGILSTLNRDTYTSIFHCHAIIHSSQDMESALVSINK